MKSICPFYTVFKAYFKIAEHAYCTDKKGHILVNLGQFKDETPLKKKQIQNFWSIKMLQHNRKSTECGYHTQ